VIRRRRERGVAASDGDLSGRFRDTWESIDALPALSAIWGNLQHYLGDADIRESDSGYREMQERELSKLVGLLREGASPAELKRVSFLTRSE
jgi:hypothetical protein